MKIIISFLMLVTLAMNLSAETSYYYSGSKRIPLYENSSKVIIKTPKGQSGLLNGNTSLKPLRMFSCDSYDMTLVEKKKNIDFSTLISPSQGKIMVYPCYKNDAGEDLVPTSYIYVELKTETDKSKLASIAAQYGYKILKQNKFMPLWYTLCIGSYTTTDAVEIAKKIKETNYFANAYPAFEIEPASISYDPKVSEQWGLYNSDYEGIDISVSNAWNYATGQGVTVAVIDNGIELNHEDLKKNILPSSYDAFTGSSPSIIHNLDEDTNHGTLCAGIIGARRNNNIGISGVAPDVKLLSVSVKFTSPNISEQLSDAINWAWQNGADVMSCSWGSDTEDPLVYQAINQAVYKGREKRGCIMVFAAGNCFFPGGKITYPANSRDDIIAVGNIEKNGVWNPSSCIGERLLVCAPGTDILSTSINNSYSEGVGTSIAAPHVSGVVALMLEINPQLSISDIREIIAKKSKKIGHMAYAIDKPFGKWNDCYGYGLIDASEAVKEVSNRLGGY